MTSPRFSCRPSSRSPLRAAYAVLFALLIPCSAGAGATQRSNEPAGPIWEYKEQVPLSIGEVRRGETCVTFEPFMQAGDFFDGLQRLDLPSGPMFRKNSTQVTTYPTYVTVDMHVNIHECDSNLYTAASSPDFVAGMKFRAQWKREMDMRPADFTVEKVPLNLEEGDNRLLFVLRIKNQNVPLTDHLIISVWTDHGKLLSRMSARL
ncbi:MAG: hypothetical protein WA823_01055 [Candidatus Acidiferrales bacterium]